MAKTLLFLALACVHGLLCSQEYPGKPVRMIVGFPPGGGTDVVARIIAPGLSELLGQAVVIENRPGATGTVAAGVVAKSPADGYTIMMGHVSVNAIAPSLFANLPYDVNTDFAPIGIAAAVPHFVVVHPSLPASSLNELIQFLKARQDQLSFPSAGNGSMPHLAGELFKALAGVDLLHVPYKGTGQSMQDLLGGQHVVAFDTMPASAPGAPGLPPHYLVWRICARRHACRGRQPAARGPREGDALARDARQARRHRRGRHGVALPRGVRRAGARGHRALCQDREGHRPQDRLTCT